ncbi:hypothetical protein MICA_223 [Micavibrio aeruginosavorus ARL-13]|uniref:Uncharacterized protein n=1 Tax=Micavibrio aeruginosavorus (strain ARL-13) TaxID=856793 RepID=G2KP61_MICAA|nr:hypothetical protein MICA_223 [Micavibrio aeruginosavorus ARL-13]
MQRFKIVYFQYVNVKNARIAGRFFDGAGGARTRAGLFDYRSNRDG